MGVYAAHKYPVGGLWTHGGDIEVHADEQPTDLRRVWTEDDGAWGEFTDKHGTYWTPIDGNGDPQAGDVEVTWVVLLLDFGPVYDEHTLVPDECTAVYT